MGLRAGAVDAVFDLYDRGYVSQVAVIGQRVFARVTGEGLDALNMTPCGRCGASTRWDYCEACEAEHCDCGAGTTGENDHAHDWLCSLTC